MIILLLLNHIKNHQIPDSRKRMRTSVSISSISELYNRQTQQDIPERTTTPPISPQNQPSHSLKYNHMTIKYAILIQQFITQMVFVKFHMLVIKQTTETLEFMTCRIDNPTNREKDRPTDFDNIYHKILLDHIADDLPKIWDEIFAEHNIDLVFRYFVDIVDHLFEYSTNTTTTDPKYTYSPQTIYKHFYSNSKYWKNNERWITIKGYLTETYSEFVQRNTISSSTQNRASYETYRRIEQEKHLRNRILEDVMDGYISTLPSGRNPSPTIDPLSYDGKPSPDHLDGVLKRHSDPPAVRLNPRTPTLLRRSGVLQFTYETPNVVSPGIEQYS